MHECARTSENFSLYFTHDGLRVLKAQRKLDVTVMIFGTMARVNSGYTHMTTQIIWRLFKRKTHRIFFDEEITFLSNNVCAL